MKKIIVISIITASLLIGCGHTGILKSNNENTIEFNNKEIPSKLLPLRNTPVSVFDLALVRTELALNRMLYGQYQNPYISAIVTYRSSKGIIDIDVAPWEFTTNQKLAKNDPRSYYDVESEKHARAKLEEIFTFTSLTIGEGDSAYFQFLYDIGGEYFKKNEKEICKELEQITKISVSTYYHEKDKTYYLSLSGPLDGKKEYQKEINNSH